MAVPKVVLISHLVGKHHRDPKFVRKSQEHPQEPGKVHLAGAELTPPGVVRPVEARGAVHLQKQGKLHPALCTAVLRTDKQPKQFTTTRAYLDSDIIAEA